MPIYRVTFHTNLLVECENENEAEKIGLQNLNDEIKNGLSSVFNICTIESSDELRAEESYSLPWRSNDRKREPDRDVNDILNHTVVTR